ncbi:hypothetical protein ACFE04_015158 [Oxalis oulophora]
MELLLLQHSPTIHTTTSRSYLLFAVNGQRFQLSNPVDPTTTLLEFLRSQTSFKSVKLGCGEGGCGACVVLLSKYDPLLDKVDDFTVSSCLTLLCSVDGCSITTSEGLGNSKDGFNSIHKRIAGFSATQCGFCTPGMCVSLCSALVNAEKTDRPNPPQGFSKLTVSEAEKAILGNLCRCTGYRPIADTCKSFASDVDMEDLGFNSFWKKGETKEEMVSKLPLYKPGNVNTFPEFLKKEIKSTGNLDLGSNFWYTPFSFEELQHLMDISDTRIKLAAGNTGISYYKELEWYDKFIDLRRIPQLSIIKRGEDGIEIGATVTISKAIEALRQEQGKNSSELVFEKIANHLEKVASVFVRNMATIGGNLVLAQKYSFPSDIATVLISINAMVNLTSDSKHEKISLEDFLERPPLDSKTVVLSVEIPHKAPTKSISRKTITKQLFETYRAAPRPLGNALPYLNAAFFANVSCERASGKTTISSCQLAFGAYGTKHAIRTREVENFFTGKVLTLAVLNEALKLLSTIVVPKNGTPHSSYRTSLAVGYLFEFFTPFIKTSAEKLNDGLKDNSRVLKSNQFDKINGPTLLSSGTQVFEFSEEYHPVGEPITKTGATLQASGEAVFVDDIPSPKNCLHGSFIYSTKPLARVKAINYKPNSQLDGVSAVISYKDIPESGQNIGSLTLLGAEPLFADELARCPGDRIALVVADTQKHADIAANHIVVDYDTENLEPIISVEDAVEKKSFFEVPDFYNPKQVGDVAKGMAEADHKIISAEIKLKSQYFFYMETQTALAVPDEDNCMVVYSSIQGPEFAHCTIAKCLGIPQHNVRVITRRAGGGFGGKATKPMPIAAACALAAQKLRRPVRVYLSRKTDMIMAGGRHPMKITYTIGYKSDGKITALQIEILINAGIYPDVSALMPKAIVGSLKKYNWGALSFDIKVCKTNQPSRTSMRAPGDLQGSFIAESIIENVASSLSMDVDSVKKINLHSYDSLSLFYEGISGDPQEYTLPSIWDKLGTSSGYNQRVSVVKDFNRSNIWIKRGISRVPIIHQVMLRATPGKVSILTDGSVAVEVGGIEIGQGLWTKVKQMTAFSLSSIGGQDLLEKVRVVQADTISLIQGNFTAGSTTSEASCEAVRMCCNILVERLTPLKDKLQNQLGSVDWETLISTASMQSVNLQACTLYVPGTSSLEYLNYGAAVEVNILTGETTILQTDIIYDCGKSLNPAVDMGQIEGAYVQGIGFFMLEEYLENSDGLVVSDGTWTYKIPTMDTIPKQFNVEILNSGDHQNRVLSSKASGEPPLLLAASVHCATRDAVREARQQLRTWSGQDGTDEAFQLDVPAILPVVKELCGLDSGGSDCVNMSNRVGRLISYWTLLYPTMSVSRNLSNTYVKNLEHVQNRDEW